MKKVAVLMSYYNGSKYVSEQIESILNQTLPQNTLLDLYVRDDGSTSSNLEILREYQNKGKLILLKGENYGVIRSFYTLLESVPNYDYYFFSDQDDVWYPDKVKVMVGELEKWSDHVNQPVGVFSDLMIADESAKPTGILMKHDIWKDYADNPTKLKQASIISNKVTGAAFAFNNAARQAAIAVGADIFCRTYMHDSTMALIIIQRGKLVYVDRPLVFYRQHGDNVIGYRGRQSVFKKIIGTKGIYHHKVTRLYEYYLLATQNFHSNDQRYLEVKKMFNRHPLLSPISAWKLRKDLYGPRKIISEFLFIIFGISEVANKQKNI